MEKVIYLDLDGTIANLYAVPDWLPKLRAEDVSPYLEAAPIENLHHLFSVMDKLIEAGWTFGIISWTSKGGSVEYNKAVRAAKIEWLEKMGFLPYLSEIHCVKYGTPKHLVPSHRRCVLIDDDDSVREKWDTYGGISADPKVECVSDLLESLLSY